MSCSHCLDVIKTYFYNFYFTYLCNIPKPEPRNKFYYLSLKKDTVWSIHGLWPQYSKNEYPCYCKKVSFDINKLKPILTELNTHWYSTKEQNEDFWKHEWEKHGSCMFTDMEELEYFKTALSLYVDAVQTNIIDKFKVSETQALIPVSLDLKIISN